MIELNTISHVHLIGVNGIGVSAIANFLVRRGIIVSGSDISLKGAGHLPEGTYWEGSQDDRITSSIDLIVYSPAVPFDDKERVKGRSLNIPELSYPEMLGVVAAGHTRTIAISGTHGKSTTTSLVGEFFEEGKFDPTVIVGGIVPKWHSNLRYGTKELFVVEACEYRAHMLHIPAQTILITNLELDHPDYYRDIAHVQDTFRDYISKQTSQDNLVVNGDDIHLSAILDHAVGRVIRYGMTGAELDLRGTVVAHDEDTQTIRMIWRGETLGEVTTRLPGTYNVMNILAGSAVFLAHGGTIDAIRNVLRDFEGVGRRFELVGYSGGSAVVSDYAHHPTALKAVTDAAKERYHEKELIVVFRPHHQERTKRLYREFMNVFSHIEHLVLLEIYDVAGRESTGNISTQQMVDELRAQGHTDAIYASTFDDARVILERKRLSEQQVVLVVGAGDADEFARSLITKAA